VFPSAILADSADSADTGADTAATSTSSNSGRQVITLGSSGLVGGLVLDELLASNAFDKIHAVVRRPLLLEHAKLHQIVVPDLHDIPNHSEFQVLAATSENKNIVAAINTLGTNEPFGKPLQDFLDIDLVLTQVFTEYCATSLPKVQYMSLLSSTGSKANPEPFSEQELKMQVSLWNMTPLYLRLKGLVENAVLTSGIAHVTIFHPANFITDTYRFGILDIVLQTICKLFNWATPPKYKSIHVKHIAHAMVRHAEENTRNPITRTPTSSPTVSRLTFADMMAYQTRQKEEAPTTEL